MTNFAKVGALVLLLVGIFALCQADRIDDMLRDPALVERQIKCALDQGPCDGVGKTVKGAIKEVIRNRCASCTPVQRKNADKIASFVRSRYPRKWAAIVAKYQ